MERDFSATLASADDDGEPRTEARSMWVLAAGESWPPMDWLFLTARGLGKSSRISSCPVTPMASAADQATAVTQWRPRSRQRRVTTGRVTSTFSSFSGPSAYFSGHGDTANSTDDHTIGTCPHWDTLICVSSRSGSFFSRVTEWDGFDWWRCRVSCWKVLGTKNLLIP